ncbi:MAG: MFS transporter [Paludibacteraceae bacterium]|nr:MFS transporter [Paludibacteraceae bacterium]
MERKTMSSWSWVPSLYFAEGLPYVIVMTLSVIMYKDLGISNDNIAFYTSWLYLPWVIKPFWSPLVELVKTKRWWIVTMQLVMGVAMAGVAFTLPTSFSFQATIAFLWVMAFSSATHDISADGFYMLAQNEENQAAFVGVRNIFYRVAMVVGQGILVMIAGLLSNVYGAVHAWSIIFYISTGLIVLLGIYHWKMLPDPESNVHKKMVGDDLINIFKTFFTKKRIVLYIGFILLYRLGESQLCKIASPFLLDSPEAGGLNISVEQVGFVYGTVGVIALLLGGLLGGYVISKYGLKKCLLPMMLALNLPDLVYVYMAYTQPDNLLLINVFVAIEQFGYGFGFTAFTMFLIYVSQGEYKTAHYSICTGLMSLGMMLPGMFAGKIQEALGYGNFFAFVCLCTIPAFVLVPFLKIPISFGANVPDLKRLEDEE